MEGKILGNRYELLCRVGTGGMAVVYKAKDKILNRFVAVKILREEFKENEEFIRRFNVESQAAASLSHQNIVQIRKRRQAPLARGGELFNADLPRA